MASPGLHSVVTRDGYVSQSPAPHFSVPSDHAMLQQFAEFLENRLQTENLGLLRRIFADFLLEHEHTLLAFLELAATIIVVKPFEQQSTRRRCRAAALLNMPKRPLNERGCVFFYLANRVHTRNMALLKIIFLEFLMHGESLIERFVARGNAVISVIPCRLARVASPMPSDAPPQKAPEQAAAPVETNASSPVPTPATVSMPPINEPTEVAIEQDVAEVEKASPPQKSPSSEPVEASSSPRSPTNSGVSNHETAAPVQHPESDPATSSVSRVETTEAPPKSEDSPQQQEPHPQQTSPRSSNPMRWRVGRPKTVAPTPEVEPAASREVKPATTLEVKPTLAATTSEVKPAVSDVQPPPKRKRNRSRKIKTEEVTVANSSTAPAAKPSSAGKKKRRRRAAHVLREPKRAPGKRQVRQPHNFASEQAVDVLSTKRLKRQPDGEADAVANAPVKATDASDATAKGEQTDGVPTRHGEGVDGSARTTSCTNGKSNN